MAAAAGRRLRRGVVAGAALLAACLFGGILFLRADKREVFFETSGELEGARLLETVPTPRGSARRLALVNDRGEAVADLWLRRPAALAAGYRVLLVYSGQGTAEKILDLVPDRDDLVLAAPQYPYRPPQSWVERLRWPFDVRRAAFRTVAGGLLAVGYLEREEGLDLRRLLVVGASLGSSFAVVHAALDPRVPRVVVVHGGGDLPGIVRAIESRRGHPWLGRLGALAAAIFVDSFEPLRYVGEIAPRPITVIGARGDHQFPAASTQALYDRARQPKTLRWTSGRHLRSAHDAALDEVLAELERLLPEAPAGE